MYSERGEVRCADEAKLVKTAPCSGFKERVHLDVHTIALSQSLS